MGLAYAVAAGFMISSLLATIRRDRFNPDEHPGDRFVAGWCAHADHVERILDGLRELREVEPLDLRLRHELTGMPADWPGPYDLGGES
jgi:hypothetical protein